VVGGELARVQRHCGDLALVDADLDPATREAGIERVVVAIKAQIGLLGHPDHEPPVDIGQPGRQRPHPSPLLDEALKRDRPDGAVSAGVGLVGLAVELVLEIQLVGKAPAGLEVRPQIAVRALEHALGLRVTRLEDDPPDPELTAEGSELRCGCPPPAWIAPSRSHTSFSGSAPSRRRQRRMPQAMSGHSLEKTSAPSTARDQHSSAVTTQPRRC
jgi:hypothetical protein